jgi:hypothetical protein
MATSNAAEPNPDTDASGGNGVLMDVVESIYTPGINSGVAICMGMLFILMFITNVGLLLAFDFNIHLIVLLCLTILLAGLMLW